MNLRIALTAFFRLTGISAVLAAGPSPNDNPVAGNPCTPVGATKMNAVQTGIFACLKDATTGNPIWKATTPPGNSWIEVYDSGWFNAVSSGSTYKTGANLPPYTLGKKADLIRLFYRVNIGFAEKEVPTYQINYAEAVSDLAWGDVYGPTTTSTDSGITLSYGSNSGGACYKFGPGISIPCGTTALGDETINGTYYYDTGQLRLIAYVFKDPP